MVPTNEVQVFIVSGVIHCKILVVFGILPYSQKYWHHLYLAFASNQVDGQAVLLKPCMLGYFNLVDFIMTITYLTFK